MSSINVVPTIQTVSKIRIQSISVVLNTSATIVVLSLDSGNRTINTTTLTLSGSDYSNWGSDDSYVTTWVLAQMGLTAS